MARIWPHQRICNVKKRLPRPVQWEVKLNEGYITLQDDWIIQAFEIIAPKINLREIRKRKLKYVSTNDNDACDIRESVLDATSARKHN